MGCPGYSIGRLGRLSKFEGSGSSREHRRRGLERSSHSSRHCSRKQKASPAMQRSNSISVAKTAAKAKSRIDERFYVLL